MKMERQVAISTGLSYTRSAEEILDLVAAAGCPRIELCLNRAFITRTCDEIVRLTCERGIAVPSLHAPLEVYWEAYGGDERQWLQHTLALARRLRAGVVVSHGVFGKDAHGQPVCLDETHLDNLREFSGSPDVHLSTELMPRLPFPSLLTDPAALTVFLRQHPGIYLTLDTCHCASLGLDLIETYERLKAHIVNIHLSDYRDGIEHKLPGAGDLPLPAFLTHLTSTGYTGLLTLEVDFDTPTRNPLPPNADLARYLADAVAYVREYLGE